MKSNFSRSSRSLENLPFKCTAFTSVVRNPLFQGMWDFLFCFHSSCLSGSLRHVDGFPALGLLRRLRCHAGYSVSSPSLFTLGIYRHRALHIAFLRSGLGNLRLVVLIHWVWFRFPFIPFTYFLYAGTFSESISDDNGFTDRNCPCAQSVFAHLHT